MKAFSHRRVKNDELDARDLADLLRMSRLAEAWIAPAEIRELREITRYRGKLVQLRTSCKDQVHGVLAKLGIEVTCSDIFGAWGTRWLDELPLPQPYCWKVASLRQLTGWLCSEITVLEQVTAELLAGHDGYRAVQQLPGIGPVLGAVIVAEIGDITRFRHPARLCSWAGLTPRHYESDTKVVRGRITKQGSRPLRWALVEAVQRTRTAPRSARPGTPSSPAAAPRRATSPRSPRPASCSPASSTRCATGTSGPWTPPRQSKRQGEQARPRAARDRFRVWPRPARRPSSRLIPLPARTSPMPRGREPRATRRDDRSQARQHRSCPWAPQPPQPHTRSCSPPPDYRLAARRVKNALAAPAAPAGLRPVLDPHGPLTRIGSSRETGNAQAQGDARGPVRHAPKRREQG